jgi:hypothetical protein
LESQLSIAPGSWLSIHHERCFNMDVSENENVAERVSSSAAPTERTVESPEFVDDHNQLVNTPQGDQNKMHVYITVFVLGLLLLIVLYGLIMQNYWLVGTVCFPVIAYGVYRIFDRYL